MARTKKKAQAMVLLGFVILLLLWMFIGLPLMTGQYRRPKDIYKDIHAFIAEHYYDPTRLSNWDRWVDERVETISTREDCVKRTQEMLNTLNDPYTIAVGPRDLEKLVRYEDGEFVGLGITLAAGYEDVTAEACETENSRTGISCTHPTILSVAPRSPAAKAEIKAGDIVLAVNGESLQGKSLDMVRIALNGKMGARVSLTLKRGTVERTVELTRTFVGRPHVVSRMLDEKVAYIRLTHFDHSVERSVKEAAQKLADAPAFIIDLRDNPGGDFFGSLRIASLFVREGVLCRTITRVPGPLAEARCVEATISIKRNGMFEEFANGERNPLRLARYSPNGDYSYEAILAGKPVIVLVNGNSASASETLAGALRDSAGATLVGTRTFGKGVAQQTYNMPRRIMLRMTTFKATLPSGFWPGDGGPNRIGIEPNVPLAKQETLFDLDTPEDEHLKVAIKIAHARLPEE